ncbi:MAG: hypothetical protein IKW89_06940 [Bacteroidales bacterium]|nr:hypothetical protein [Bacteroidales bacterium]
MNSNFIHYRLRRFCAFIIGLVFLLAGVFKLLDPVGAGLVVEEYYRFLGLTFMLPTAKAVAVFLALLEAILGAAMISGVWRDIVAIATSALIVFFTIITLFLAIFNPSMDCGCFGEVIHLSNMQTFLKNVILLVLAIIAFAPFKDLGEPKKRKYISFFIAAASIAGFTLYSLNSLPLVDYTSFRPGSELVSSSNEDNDFKSTFIYEKNGQKGVFTLDKLPDSTWTFVKAETVRMNGPKAGGEPPILTFTDTTGTYRDELATSGNVMAFSVYDLAGMKGDDWTRIATAIDGASKAGFTPLLIVSGNKTRFENLPALIPEARESLLPHLFFTDRKTLLAMNRSNGGGTWFNDGELIKKYHSGSLPTEEQFLEMTGDDPTDIMLHSSTKGRLRFQGFLLYTIALLLLI